MNNLETSELFINFISNLVQQYSIYAIDFLACDIGSDQLWISFFNKINETLNISVRGSTDITGYSGNFIEEIGNVDLKDIYFTETIELWRGNFAAPIRFNLATNIYFDMSYNNITLSNYKIIYDISTNFSTSTTAIRVSDISSIKNLTYSYGLVSVSESGLFLAVSGTIKNLTGSERKISCKVGTTSTTTF